MKNIKIIHTNKDNEDAVRHLKTKKGQEDFIETIDECLEEAEHKSYNIDWQTMAICNDEIVVGFAMYGKSTCGDIWLDRFMIDEHYQNMGYGKIALEKLIDMLYSEFKTDKLYLSVNKNNAVAIKLYEKMGFVMTDDLDGKDPVMMHQKQ